MKSFLSRKNLSRGLGVLALSLLVNATSAELPAAEAISLGKLGKVGKVVDTVKEQEQIKKSLDYYENEGRHELFEELKKSDGVNTDPGYNQLLTNIMTKLSAGIAKSDPSITGKPYNYFVNPEEVFNAYCTLGHNISVNTGVFYFFENHEDRVAVVVAHEMAHGQKRHPIEGAKKKMTVELVSQLASVGMNDKGLLAADVVANQVKTVGVTKKNEVEADAVAFIYIADSGYNVGAPAAVWQRVIENSSGASKNIFDDILNPSTHPENKSRRDAYAKQLTEYSKKKVTVDANSGEVKINGKSFMKPVTAGSMSGAERSYFVAGNLARIYHDNSTVGTARNDNGTVRVGAQAVVTPAAGDATADELVALFNQIK